jgi:ABC-2 type transport system ATP-binding protein
MIEASDVVKRFGKTVALDGLDLVADQGVILAVLGPNGAGKTTFVRCIATLIKPDAGTLRVFGHDVDREPHAVRLSIGLADADRLVREYSGGMRRKLDLGASLVGTPRLLLLDEPTTGVDPASRIDLWDAIRTLVSRGTSVLLTTQYLDEADHLADQIVIVDHGKSIAHGTPAELKKRTGRNVIEVHVRDREHVAGAAKVFADIGDGDLQTDAATRQVAVVVKGGAEQLGLTFQLLEAAGIMVDDMALRPPRLDEAFLELTGHKLQEHDGRVGDPQNPEPKNAHSSDSIKA